MDEFFAILTKTGVPAAEATGIVVTTWLMVQALKKSIARLQGDWCLVASIIVAGIQGIILYHDWRAWLAVAVFCGIAGASGGWQGLKDLFDRARGKDTNVPEGKPLANPSTREEAGK